MIPMIQLVMMLSYPLLPILLLPHIQ